MTLRKLPRRVRLVLGALLALVPILAACAPAAVAGNPSDYSVNTHLGQRLRWNPCAPIHWRADLRNAPAGTLSALKSAVAALSSKSGIPFVYDGAATFIPQRGGPAGPAPLVVSFGRRPGRPSASNYLTGGTNVGYGGFTATGVYVQGKAVYKITRGFAVIDADRYPFLSSKVKQGVLMHELGHAVGLNHAKYSSELMYPTISNSSPSGYSAGDLNGLRLVGRSAGCL
jgi:matrixin